MAIAQVENKMEKSKIIMQGFLRQYMKKTTIKIIFIQYYEKSNIVYLR